MGCNSGPGVPFSKKSVATIKENKSKAFLEVLDKWSFQDWQAFNRAYGTSCPLGRLAEKCALDGFLRTKEGQIWWKDEKALGPEDLGKHLLQVEKARAYKFSGDFLEVPAPLKSGE